jgi:peptidoglycan/LPS O-acetylase OafA/YrhL
MEPAPQKNSDALDQWRGLALVFVLISHGFFFTGRVQGLGRIGVDLFFFISGILVYRSLTSSRRTGVARSFSFWKRRIVRLYPALVGYVAAMTLLVFLLPQRPGMPPGSDFGTFFQHIFPALFYAVDYDASVPMSLGHLWSVSVEMQFYLLTPLIFFLGGKSGPQRLFIWLVLLLILMAFGVAEPFRGYQEKYHFEVAAWPMMLGFLSEYLKARIGGLPRRLARVAILAGCVLAVLAIILSGLDLKKGLVIALGATIFVPCFLCYLTNSTVPAAGGHALTLLGQRTYSIYLWQQPLTLCGYLPNDAHPLGAVIAIGIGAIWYHYLEAPFLSTRRRQTTEEVGPASQA